MATFANLSINKAGTGYTLAATATGLTGHQQRVQRDGRGSGEAGVHEQPTNVVAGSITPAVTVTIEDSQGNTVTTATNGSDDGIGTNPSSGILTGTRTATAVNGVATFATLSINKSGIGYTLAASATGSDGVDQQRLQRDGGDGNEAGVHGAADECGGGGGDHAGSDGDH